MAASVFADKSRQPDRAQLDRALGESRALLREIEEFLERDCGRVEMVWKFYGKQSGWTLACELKRRRVFHLTPQDGFFATTFILGSRAVAACRDAGLAAEVLEALEAAPAYAEGRGIRLEVRDAAGVATITRLAAIKLAH